MRYVVRRISPWSAAKVGSVVGLLQGVVVGLLISAAGKAAAPYLAYADQPVASIGWAAASLTALFVAALTVVVFALAAVVYNAAAWLGAGVVVDLSEAGKSAVEPPADDERSAREPFLQDEILSPE